MKKKMIRLPGLDLNYKTGCDCPFCNMNKRTYQYMVRKIFGRSEWSPNSNRERFI